MRFRVVDNKTGKEADTWNIALHEEWAQGLVYCDMEGFLISEDGQLMLADECGHVVYCDSERFKVVFEDERPHGEWVKKGDMFYTYECSVCGKTTLKEWRTDFCPWCGADMRVKNELNRVSKELNKELNSENTTLLYSITNGDNFIGKEGEAE